MKKLFLLLLLISCSGKENVNSLTPGDFDAKLKNTPNAILLDVRTEEELKEGMLEGAQNIVYDKAFDQKLGGLLKETPIFIYCAKGKRSSQAAEILKEKGFREVYQLKGGIVAWREANMPVEAK